jgi:hypothetical protein
MSASPVPSKPPIEQEKNDTEPFLVWFGLSLGFV